MGLGRGGTEGRQPLAVVALEESGSFLGMADCGGGAALGDAAPARVKLLLRGLAPGFPRLMPPGVPRLLRRPLGAPVVAGAP